jgi:hypothetical protein
MIYYQTVQLVIFLPTFNASCMLLKIDVTKRAKKLRIWKGREQGLVHIWEVSISSFTLVSAT